MWKILVLLAGLVGIVGFFLPLRVLSGLDGHTGTHASAYEIAQGVDETQQLITYAEQLGISTRELSASLDQNLEHYRYAILGMFVPSFLLLVIGIVAIGRGGLGRLGGFLAMAFGAASLLAFVGALLLAGDLVLHHDAIEVRLASTMGPGMYCLLAAGVVGMFAGAAALLRPDHLDDRVELVP